MRVFLFCVVLFSFMTGCSNQTEQASESVDDSSSQSTNQLSTEPMEDQNDQLFALPPIDDELGRKFVDNCARVLVENSSAESFEALDKCGCVYNTSVDEFGGKEAFHRLLNSQEDIPEYKLNRYHDIKEQCYTKVDILMKEKLTEQANVEPENKDELSVAIKDDFIEMCLPDTPSSDGSDELICACAFNKVIDEYGSKTLIEIMYEDYRPEGLSDNLERFAAQCGKN